MDINFDRSVDSVMTEDCVAFDCAPPTAKNVYLLQYLHVKMQLSLIQQNSEECNRLVNLSNPEVRHC